MLSLPADVQRRIWKSYFSAHVCVCLDDAERRMLTDCSRGVSDEYGRPYMTTFQTTFQSLLRLS